MPSPLPRQDRWTLLARAFPSTSAFPVYWAGQLLHRYFRGLLSVYSRYGLPIRGVTYVTLSIRGFSSVVTSAVAPIATGWSEPVPGRDSPPLWIGAFSRRTSKLPLDCLAVMRSRVRTSPGPPTNSFRFNAILFSIAANSARIYQNWSKSQLIYPCCSKNTGMLVGVPIELGQRLAHHCELRLAKALEYLGVALAEHLRDEVIRHSARA